MTPALTTDVRDGIAIVTLDVPNAPVNTFSRSVRDEFGALLDRLERDESDARGGDPQRQAGRLGRRRRHRGVSRESRRHRRPRR